MDRGYIDLNRLNLDELVSVVNLYPWFAGARKELCRRMMRMGADWEDSQYADAAIYFPSRRILSDMIRSAQVKDWEDADVEEIIKSYIVSEPDVKVENDSPKRRVYAGAGDYFSQDDYDKVKRSDDNVFSRYAAKAAKENKTEAESAPVFDIFTETLAQIYAEQGYYDQAKEIYSKLILAYPEKNAYFAALIQKLDELN